MCRSFGATNPLKLFEFDTRFSVYAGEFRFYDYKDPLNLGDELPQSADVIFVDPPFLSEECFRKVHKTVEYLKHNKTRIIINTGYVMKGLIYELFHANITSFEPKHENGLANDFRCYTNYQSEFMKWDAEEIVDH
jgi:hypothetical protein